MKVLQPARLVWVLAGVVALAVSAGIAPDTADAAPAMSLSPDTGDAPSASGTIAGAGWVCASGSPPGFAATVSGNGASGSATISRDGTLSGDFAVDGNPGDSVRITVQTVDACPSLGPPIYLTANAIFRFRDPTPEPDTATPRPTFTPLPTSTYTSIPAVTATATSPAVEPTRPPPPATATPVRPGAAATIPATAPAGSATASATASATPGPGADSGDLEIVFAGCVPAEPVTFEFVPLYLIGLEPPSEVPSGPGLMVPAVQRGGGFALKPPAAEPGRLFHVKPKSEDEKCKLEDDEGSYWLPGEGLLVPMVIPGATKLEICAVGNKTPCEFAEVKGARIERDGAAVYDATEAIAETAWDTEKSYFAEDLKKGPFRFRSTVEGDATAAKLQASVLPFQKGAEVDALAPQGLVGTWEITCVNCEFTADLASLAPDEPPKKKSFFKKTWDAAKKPFTIAIDGIAGLVGGLFGGGGGGDDAVVEAVESPPGATLPGAYVVASPVKLPAPTTFYFRLLPMSGEPATSAGPASNTVTLQQVAKPPAFKFESSPTPAPTQSAYEVEIISYHGIIPPKNPNKVCYVATQNAWAADIFAMTYTTDPNKAIGGLPGVKAGDLICKPSPQSPSIFEAIISWTEDAMNWASEAWSDLKDFAVDVILKFTPLGASCGLAEDAGAIPAGSCEQAFAIALDAALASLGIPPDIPNFDQLMDQGAAYLASELAAQVGIPPDVVKAAVEEGGPYAGLALNVAEEKLREELETQLAAKLKESAKQIQLGHAAAVPWVPDGIPVRPDDYQPPGMSVRVTRKAGVAGGDDGCVLAVTDSLKLSEQAIKQPPPGYESFVKGLQTPLSSLTLYNLFVDEKGLGIDKYLHVPPLAAGDSHEIPMTFQPNYYKSGWSPNGLIPTSDYISVWRYLHDFGEVRLAVTGCGADVLEVPAASTVSVP